MKTKLVFLALILLTTWVSGAQISQLVAENNPGSNKLSGDEKALKNKKTLISNTPRADENSQDISKSYAMIHLPLGDIMEAEAGSPANGNYLHTSPVVVPYRSFSEDKIDVNYRCGWIVQKERSLSDACQLADWFLYDDSENGKINIAVSHSYGL